MVIKSIVNFAHTLQTNFQGHLARTDQTKSKKSTKCDLNSIAIFFFILFFLPPNRVLFENLFYASLGDVNQFFYGYVC